jgi:hypothetical protein
LVFVANWGFATWGVVTFRALGSCPVAPNLIGALRDCAYGVAEFIKSRRTVGIVKRVNRTTHESLRIVQYGLDFRHIQTGMISRVHVTILP